MRGPSERFQGRTLKVQLDRGGTLNLIPVDLAVAEMIDLSALGEPTLDEVFHLTSESPVGVHDAIGVALELVGINRFDVVRPAVELDHADRVFNRSLKYHAPYFGQRKIFERANVARFDVDRHQLGYPMDVGRLRPFIGHNLVAKRLEILESKVDFASPEFNVSPFVTPELVGA